MRSERPSQTAMSPSLRRRAEEQQDSATQAFDVDYPLHRYFSLTKDLARLVGGAHVRLDELADITDVPADDTRIAEVPDVH